MSTVWDVETLSIDDGPEVDFSAQVDSVVISVESDIESVTISQPDEVEAVIVEVPGMQGAPGLQNVYVQAENPAVQYGWGMEQKGYIWIEVEV